MAMSNKEQHALSSIKTLAEWNNNEEEFNIICNMMQDKEETITFLMKQVEVMTNYISNETKEFKTVQDVQKFFRRKALEEMENN